MLKNRSIQGYALLTAVVCAAASNLLPATAGEKTIHVFKGGNDGAFPTYGGLISDGDGNSYGTTNGGGTLDCEGGCGTVYKLTKEWKESVLYAFKGGSDGEEPFGALMMDASGNLYGTTVFGGDGTGCDNASGGCGTVFKITPDGRETVLYAFQGGSDGYYPEENIVIDQSGNLYGTTGGGGAYNSGCETYGCGTVFELQPDGTKISLYEFQGGTDGEVPTGSLIADSSGNLYGTTAAGGGCSFNPTSGCGTVYKLTPNGQETILYAFQGGTDGYVPFGGVVMDTAGNLYGTTRNGGLADSQSGVVFRIPAGGGSESVLYTFRGGHDGANPVAGVIRDSDGNLYGTTEAGGGKGCKKLFGVSIGCGAVFELTPEGQENVLFAFSGKYGQLPEAPVLLGKNGNLYGTTTQGGAHRDGVIFEVKK